MRWRTALLVLVFVSALGAVASSSASTKYEGRWWVGHSLTYRLHGQLVLRGDARETLRMIERHPHLRRIEPRATAKAERDARRMLFVLRHEIPDTREGLAAERIAAQVSASSPAPVWDAVTGEWSIPGYIVSCESGGDYNAVNPSSGAYGAYQIMPSHWSPGGVCYGLGMDPAGQDECARRVWSSEGAGAWDCA